MKKVRRFAYLSLASTAMALAVMPGSKTSAAKAIDTVIDPAIDIGMKCNISAIGTTGWKTAEFKISGINTASSDGEYIAVAMKHPTGSVWGGLKLNFDKWYQQAHLGLSDSVTKVNKYYNFDGTLSSVDGGVPNFRNQYLPQHFVNNFNGYYVLPKESFKHDGGDKLTDPFNTDSQLKDLVFCTYYTDSTSLDISFGNIYSADIVDNKLVLRTPYVDWSDLSKTYTISKTDNIENISVGRDNAENLEIINKAIQLDQYAVTNDTELAAVKEEFTTTIEGYQTSELAIFNSVVSKKFGTVGEKWAKIQSGEILVPAYQHVLELIDDIGSVTLSSKDAITAAREAYEALGEEDKAEITAQQLKVLTDAEDAYELAVLNQGEADVDLVNALRFKTVCTPVASQWPLLSWYSDDLENRNLKLDQGQYIALRLKSGTYGSYFDFAVNNGGNCVRPNKQGEANQMTAKTYKADGTFVKDVATRNNNISINLPGNFDGYYLLPKEQFGRVHFIKEGGTFSWNDSLSAFYFFFYAHDSSNPVDFKIGNIYNADIVDGKVKLNSIILDFNKRSGTSLVKGQSGDFTKVALTREFPELNDLAEFAKQLISVDTTVLQNCKDASTLVESYESLTEKEKIYVNRAKRLGVTASQKVADINGMIAAEEPAAAVEELIGEIPATVEFTQASLDAITAAREAYDELTSYGKALVSESNLAILTSAETTYEQLKIAAEAESYHTQTVALFNAIGTVEFTTDCKDKIDAAREAYDGLPASVQALFTNAELEILTNAEAAYDDLVAQDDAAKVVAKIEAIGEVHIASKVAIEEARAAYDELSAAAKAYVTEAQLNVLTDAEAEYPSVYKHEAEADVDLYNSLEVKTAADTPLTGFPGVEWYVNEFVSRDVSLTKGEYIALRIKVKGPGSYFDIIPNVSGNASRPEYVEAAGKMNALAVRNDSDLVETITARDWALSLNLRGNFDGYYLFPKEAFTHIHFGTDINWDNELSAVYFEFYSNDGANALDIEIGNMYNADFSTETGMVLNEQILDLDQITGLNFVQGKNANCSKMDFSRNGEGLKELVALGKDILDVDYEDVTECVANYADLKASFDLLSEDDQAFVERVSRFGVEAGDVLEFMKGMVDAKEDADACIALIDALSTTVVTTDAYVAQAESAAAAYILLDKYGQLQVGAERFTKLTNIMETLIHMGNAEDVVALINAIGTVELTNACKAKIDAARKAYDELEDSETIYITEAQLKVLTDAEAEYAALAQYAADLAEAKETALSAIDEYAATIDMSRYSTENKAAIAAAIEAAKTAVNSGTDIEVVEGLFAELQTTIQAIPVLAPKGGCGGSVVATSVLISVLSLAGIAFLAKRKED